MRTSNKPQLTSAEISSLWTAYIQGTMIICGLNYFIAKTEDEEIASVLKFALNITKQQVDRITTIFQMEEYPIPDGFTDKDVDVNAPRLFSDVFFLIYILNMASFSLSAYGIALGTSTRSDIVTFYNESLDQIQELHVKAKKLALEKGVYLREPTLPKPERIDYVTKQSFLTGWFGNRRPLLGVEITNLIINMKRNSIGRSLIIGFSQVANAKEVRKYMERGRDIAQKHYEIFSSVLKDEYLPTPMSWDHTITDSRISPFSDKLMMFHIAALIASGIGQYGIAMSVSPRRDLGLHYVRLSAEIAKYAEDGANIMIDNGWMEQPPQSVDREKLAKRKD